MKSMHDGDDVSSTFMSILDKRLVREYIKYGYTMVMNLKLT